MQLAVRSTAAWTGTWCWRLWPGMVAAWPSRGLRCARSCPLPPRQGSRGSQLHGAPCSELLQALRTNPDALEFVPEHLKARPSCSVDLQLPPRPSRCYLRLCQSDRNFVVIALARDGAALRFAAAQLRDDRELVLSAVQQNPAAMAFAGDLCAKEAWWISRISPLQVRLWQRIGTSCYRWCGFMAKLWSTRHSSKLTRHVGSEPLQGSSTLEAAVLDCESSRLERNLQLACTRYGRP